MEDVVIRNLLIISNSKAFTVKDKRLLIERYAGKESIKDLIFFAKRLGLDLSNFKFKKRD